MISRSRYYALSSIEGAAVFFAVFHRESADCITVLASLQAEISEIAVIGQICTQNNIKCSRKVILTFQRELNKINEVYVCHLPHCSY